MFKTHHPGTKIIHLHVSNGDEVSWFLQAVESSSFHELAHDLVGNLVAPLIDDGHVDVINEHRHLFASRGAIGCTHPLVHEALNGSLETRTHTWYKLTQLHSIHPVHV